MRRDVGGEGLEEEEEEEKEEVVVVVEEEVVDMDVEVDGGGGGGSGGGGGGGGRERGGCKPNHTRGVPLSCSRPLSVRTDVKSASNNRW